MKKRNNRVIHKKEYKSLDYYPTMDDESIKSFLKKEFFVGGIWEPCCGEGYLSISIQSEIDNPIVNSDVFPYGETDGNGNFLTTRGVDAQIIDFLTYNTDNEIAPNTPNIITNPPYTECRDSLFTLKSIEYCQKHNGKLALLMNTKYRHGVTRHENIFSIYPYTKVYDYIRRIKIYKNGVETSSGMADYSWFVWDFTSGELPKEDTKAYHI